tara:strand:- start:370 stop:666 length:297 start_codon:yes stop_codon:yes gene_type:complete
MKEENDDNITEDIENDKGESSYVDGLHPLYQRLRADGHMDAILKMRHDPVQLEAAEKVTAALVSQLAPALEAVEKVKNDPVELAKLRKAIASWAKTRS